MINFHIPLPNYGRTKFTPSICSALENRVLYSKWPYKIIWEILCLLRYYIRLRDNDDDILMSTLSTVKKLVQKLEIYFCMKKFAWSDLCRKLKCPWRLKLVSAKCNDENLCRLWPFKLVDYFLIAVQENYENYAAGSIQPMQVVMMCKRNFLDRKNLIREIWENKVIISKFGQIQGWSHPYSLFRDGSKLNGYPGREHRQWAKIFFQEKGVRRLFSKKN